MRFATWLVAAALAASPASAAVVVLGGSYAQSCYQAAESRRDPRGALRICDSALLDSALAPADRAATLVNRGIVQMHARNIVAAIADYDAAISAHPDIAEAWINKGLAYLELGNRDAEAAVLLTEGLARNPLRPAIAYFSRAQAYEGLGRTRDAYEDYGRAAALEPDWDQPARELQRFKVVRGKTLAG